MALNPLYFGSSGHRLFGMYHPSATGGRRGAVLCAPWGQEYLRAHQSLTHLARALARAGVHAFRFDYYGTGDSAGSDLDGALHQWVADTGCAIDELKDTVGLGAVSIVGLRLGAVIGALAAAPRRDIHRVVLWDPVFDGAAQIADALAGNAAPVAFPAQLRGFPVAAGVCDEIAAVSLRAFNGPLPPTLVVTTTSPGAADPLAKHLQAASVQVASEFHAGPAAWLEDDNFGAAGMPVVAVQAIARWLAS